MNGKRRALTQTNELMNEKFNKLSFEEKMNVLNVDENIKVNRQYFGMSDMVGVDVDILNFKGVNAYNDTQSINYGYSNGFHLDVRLNKTQFTGNTVTVDGNTGYTFTTVDTNLLPEIDSPQMARISSESIMEYNVYSDKRLRKFTCYPYGGFDGWDIYREERTNTAEFKANKYKGILYEDTSYLKDVTPYTALTESYYGSSGNLISDTTGDTYTNYKANLYALENGKEYKFTQCDTTQPIYTYEKTNGAYIPLKTVSNQKEYTVKCTNENIYVQLIYNNKRKGERYHEKTVIASFSSSLCFSAGRMRRRKRKDPRRERKPQQSANRKTRRKA